MGKIGYSSSLIGPYRSISTGPGGRDDELGRRVTGLAGVGVRAARPGRDGGLPPQWLARDPSLAQIGGHTVELLAFTSDEPASVILIGADGHHLTLHVIRPDAGEEAARQALEQARVPADDGVPPRSRSTVARSVADVADKLARHEGLGDEQRTAQIKRWSEEAAEQFVDAPVQTFVPILVEHIVRNRMVESRGEPPSVLPASHR